jgi:hypothetical protein
MFDIETRKISDLKSILKIKYRSKIRSKWQCVSTMTKDLSFVNRFDILIIVSRNKTDV